jgi:hypothetical protein
VLSIARATAARREHKPESREKKRTRRSHSWPDAVASPSLRAFQRASVPGEPLPLLLDLSCEPAKARLSLTPKCTSLKAENGFATLVHEMVLCPAKSPYAHKEVQLLPQSLIQAQNVYSLKASWFEQHETLPERKYTIINCRAMIQWFLSCRDSM